MTTYNFATCPERAGSDSGKWARYAGRDIIPAWVADMDFEVAPEIRAALQARLDHGVFGYPVQPPKTAVDAVVAYLEKRHGWSIDPSWLVFTPALVPGLHATIRACSKPGETVVTHIPIYPPFLSAPVLSERTRQTHPMAWNAARSRWELDLDALSAATPADARVYMLCNPYNPLGRVFDREELLAVAAYAEKHNLVICSDEIHCDLILDESKRHIPIATLSPEIAQRTVTLYAASKTYNIPGLFCGFAVIPNADIRAAYRRVIQGLAHEVGVFGYAALVAAYNDGETWRQSLLTVLRRNLDRLCEVVAATPGVKLVQRPEATYLAWIDVSELGFEHPQAAFEAGGVGFNNGADFAVPGHVRINFGCPPARLEEILRRFRAVAEARMAGKR